MTQAETNAATESDLSSIVETSLIEIRNIATLPAVALKVVRLTEDPQATAEEVNKVITSDPALSIRILKVVNSSFYGVTRQIDSIQRAVQLLGLDVVKNIAIAASVHKVFQFERIRPGFDASELWIHSIAVASGARGLALKAGLDLADEAFLAGLIHDVGIMVEMQAFRQKFAEMIQVLSDDQLLTLRQAEERMLGATHEAFGAGLCRRWKFPLHLEHVAGYHHQPMALPETDRTLPSIVHVADILAARIGAVHTRTVETDVVDPQVLQSLNLSEGDLQSVAETLPEEIREAQQLLSDGGS